MLGLPFLGFLLIALAAADVIRRPGEGVAPSKRAEKVIMWSSIGEGVGLFAAAQAHDEPRPSPIAAASHGDRRRAALPADRLRRTVRAFLPAGRGASRREAGWASSFRRPPAARWRASPRRRPSGWPRRSPFAATAAPGPAEGPLYQSGHADPPWLTDPQPSSAKMRGCRLTFWRFPADSRPVVGTLAGNGRVAAAQILEHLSVDLRHLDDGHGSICLRLLRSARLSRHASSPGRCTL